MQRQLPKFNLVLNSLFSKIHLWISQKRIHKTFAVQDGFLIWQIGVIRLQREKSVLTVYRKNMLKSFDFSMFFNFSLYSSTDKISLTHALIHAGKGLESIGLDKIPPESRFLCPPAVCYMAAAIKPPIFWAASFCMSFVTFV